MLIVGAGGAAKDLLAMLAAEPVMPEVAVFDDVHPEQPDFLYGRYRMLRNSADAAAYLREKDDRFALGVGSPVVRRLLAHRFEQLGGRLVTLISRNSHVGTHLDLSTRGVIVMHGAIVTNSVVIEDGALINMHCTIGHGTHIGRWCELAPGVRISDAHIDALTQIGINATVIPRVRVGRNVTIGAGAVVTQDIPDNWRIAGVPARKIGENPAVEVHGA